MTGLSAKEVEQGLEALQNQVCISLEAIEEDLFRSQDGQEGDLFSLPSSKNLLINLPNLSMN